LRAVKGKITVKLVLAVIQSLTALAAIILAILLNFNLLSQTVLNIPEESQYFYVVMFIIFGFVFLISGFFLMYEWWENR
jgi:glucan phosphoethanolaminetransferase (alkaline phosphatase superfamily)